MLLLPHSSQAIGTQVEVTLEYLLVWTYPERILLHEILAMTFKLIFVFLCSLIFDHRMQVLKNRSLLFLSDFSPLSIYFLILPGLQYLGVPQVLMVFSINIIEINKQVLLLKEVQIRLFVYLM